jgi:hypothetical protein
VAQAIDEFQTIAAVAQFRETGPALAIEAILTARLALDDTDLPISQIEDVSPAMREPQKARAVLSAA